MATTTGCGALFRKPEATALHVEPPVKQELTVEQRGQTYQAAFQHGLELTRKGEYGLALGAYEAAVEMNPNSKEALFNLGASHEALGDPFKALTLYRRVLAIDPDDADTYRNIGTCCMKLAHRERNGAWLDMARSAWQRSLELQPNQPDVAGYLAGLDADEAP